MSKQIAIVGAGIGGLATTALAAQEGHRVTLFKRLAQPRPVGAGLMVLDQLGIVAAARSLSTSIRRMLGHDRRKGRVALDILYPADMPGRAFHRASLFDLLWRAAQAAGIASIPDARVADAPLQSGKGHLLLTEVPREGPFDLVIDARGAGSALSHMRARTLAFGALWASTPRTDRTDPATDTLHQRYEGAQRMAGILPGMRRVLSHAIAGSLLPPRAGERLPPCEPRYLREE